MKINKIIHIVLFMIPVLLTGCATKTPCSNLIPGACIAAKRQTLMEKIRPFKDQAKFLFTPAKIYRAFITRHLSSNGEVVGDHYVYWHTKGHWNVPSHGGSGIGADLLKPAREQK